MSIWGKIVGGAVGLMIGGPIGALLGAIAGHYWVDKKKRAVTVQSGQGFEPERPSGLFRDQVTFTIAVIALGAKMAKADGQVTQDEVEAFRRIFTVPPEETENLRHVFNLARQSVAGYEAYAAQAAQLFADRPAVLEDLLDALFEIAKADKRLHEGEESYLRTVARIFGFNEEQYATFRARHFGPDRNDPYQVLGVARTASDAEVRAKYLALVKENHPDAWIARGVPEEFVKVAEAKLAAINAAWEKIKAARGIA